MQHSYYSSGRAVASEYKIPKKIDFWTFSKLESNYREQIDFLKSELRARDETIKNLRVPVVSPNSSVPNPVEYKSVGKVNPARALAQMEIRERELYWKKIMEEKEAKEKELANTVIVEN